MSAPDLFQPEPRPGVYIGEPPCPDGTHHTAGPAFGHEASCSKCGGKPAKDGLEPCPCGSYIRLRAPCTQCGKSALVDGPDSDSMLCHHCGVLVCVGCGQWKTEGVLMLCESCGEAAAEEAVAVAIYEAAEAVEQAKERLRIAGKEYGYAKADLARAEKELHQLQPEIEGAS